MPTDDSLIYYGDACKALGSGKIGGIVAPFASPAAPDPQNEYFDEGTDFGFDVSTKARVVYHHGFTKAHGPRKLGVAEMSVTPAGVAGEMQLDMGTPLGVQLYAMAEKGELFFSSGSTDRLVVREAVKGAIRLASWPIAEISLTPRPVDRRARAYALKAIVDPDATGESDEPMADDEGAETCPKCGHKYTKPRAAAKALDDQVIAGGSVSEHPLMDRLQRLVSDLAEASCLFDKAAISRKSDGRNLSKAKRDEFKAVLDAATDVWRASRAGPDASEVRAMKTALLRHEMASIGN